LIARIAEIYRLLKRKLITPSFIKIDGELFLHTVNDAFSKAELSKEIADNPELDSMVNEPCDKSFFADTGLIDLEDNTAAAENESMELKLYSFTYLLSKVEDIEVALFDKNNVTQYNNIGQFGLNGFQWPAGAWEPPPVSGERLRVPSNLINLMILEALRYYFGDDRRLINYTGPGGYPYGPTLKNYTPYPDAKSGTFYLKKEIIPQYLPGNIDHYSIYQRFCFRIGNEIYITYSEFTQEGNSRTDWYKVFKFYLNDDLDLLNDTMIFDWEIEANYTTEKPVSFWNLFKDHYQLTRRQPEKQLSGLAGVTAAGLTG